MLRSRGKGHSPTKPKAVSQAAPRGIAEVCDLSPAEYRAICRALPVAHARRTRFGERTMYIPTLLEGISWDRYTALLKALGDHRFRHSYDAGRLEALISPRLDHDWVKRLLGRCIETLCLELDIPLKSIGSTTLRQAMGKKGLEPDKCYYIQREAAVRGKERHDVESDPAPDLALEVDVASKSIERLSVYAALGVPEVWRWDGKKLEFLALGMDAEYHVRRNSLAFPFLKPGDVVDALSQRTTTDENSVVRIFVRAAVAARSSSGK